MGYKEKRYKYSLGKTILMIAPTLMSTAVGLVVLPRWCRTLLNVLEDLLQGHQPTGDELTFLISAWIPLFLAGTMSTLYTEVVASDEGMKVRVLIFKWMFVPWEDVLGITITPLPGGNDPNLWRFVQVRKLTLFHRVAGLAYYTGLYPVLIINKHIEDYEELIRIIEEHIAQRKGQSAT